MLVCLAEMLILGLRLVLQLITWLAAIESMWPKRNVCGRVYQVAS